MLFYIHGFGSSGLSKKAQLLKAHFGEKEVFAPFLSHIPDLAMHTLSQMIVQEGGNHGFENFEAMFQTIDDFRLS